MEGNVNLDQYKRQLLAKEQELSAHIKRAGASAREPGDQSTRDAGDESINNERKEELLWQVDAELTLQNEVRDILPHAIGIGMSRQPSGKANGARGTPTFFINGELHTGEEALEREVLEAVGRMQRDS